MRVLPHTNTDGQRITWGSGPDREDLAREIEEERQIVLFKGVFEPGQMRDLRRAIVGWGAGTPPLPAGQSASVPGLSFHRKDDGSAATLMPHIFHQYGFASFDHLPEGLAQALESLAGALLELQNRLAGTAFGFAGTYRLKAIRHPRGGGFLVPHTHPRFPQRVAIFLNLSEPGVDYQSGGARFREPAGWCDTSADFGIGDVLAWRYDLVHEVAPIDPPGPPDWTGDDGFWVLANETAESYPNSGLAP